MSSQSSSKMFCNICQTLDFAILYGGKRLDEQSRTSLFRVLGTGRDIADRASKCLFCEWVTRNIEWHHASDPDRIAGKQIKLCVDGSGIYQGRDYSSLTGFLIPIVRLKVEPFSEDDAIAELRAVVTNMPVDAQSVEQRTKVIDRKATTILQFRYWLGACQNSLPHGKDVKSCEKTRRDHHQEVPGFRLIDTVERRVVPATSNEEYLALSYVWGKDAQKTFPNAVGVLKSQPRTIEDSIELTKSLGFRYIWVDAICIPQDDAALRQVQIRQMNHIYQGAMGTIVAAGSNAASGLEGLSLNPNPFQSLQIGTLLIEWRRTPWKYLMATLGSADSLFLPWSTRGWTFQEALMSNRLLIFAPDHLLLECPSGTRQTMATDYVEQIETSFFNDLENIRSDGMLPWNMHWYQQMLNQYLKRNLTYESDILSAFTGIANYIASTVHESCCWAIPRRDFLAALMWAAPPGSRTFEPRDVELDDGHRPPSWHWSHLKLGSIAFVAGSEPLLIYKSAEQDFTSRFNDEQWQLLEDTGILDFEGTVIDYDPGNQVARESDVDSRQNAQTAWTAKRGCFISCRSWEFASTTVDVNEPNPVSTHVTRLGNPEPIKENYQFTLLVRWEGCIGLRAGWCVVSLDEWKAAEPKQTRLRLG